TRRERGGQPSRMSMSGTSATAKPADACAVCLRRSWLLSSLSGPIEYCARDRARLLELLALPDAQLLEALAGTHAAELRARYERFRADELPHDPQLRSICRHGRGYPRALDGPAAPPMLHVAGGTARLAKLTAAPMVSILGSRAASDYGIQMARGLARGLAASGVTVAASLTDGIAVAAHAGALDAGGGSVAVMGGGLGVSCPPRRRSLYDRVTRQGCAVSELPHDCAGRRWGQLASERILAELPRVAVVVEADAKPGELAPARNAQALGRTVAAVPGRVTSPLSRGTNALLIGGASLVRGPGDVLDLLCAAGATQPRERISAPGGATSRKDLRPGLRAVLERVGAGCDTPDELARAGVELSAALLALSELELTGLLVRGDGGRYLPRNPL
ncbi:MAG: protecting protein DprA, partial [Solirubrobacterales bacterium]|nr:protecting protein DprA [Solirubrobacterales bacterium]